MWSGRRDSTVRRRRRANLGLEWRLYFESAIVVRGYVTPASIESRTRGMRRRANGRCAIYAVLRGAEGEL